MNIAGKAARFLADPCGALGLAEEGWRRPALAAAAAAAAVLALGHFPIIGALSLSDLDPGAIRGSAASAVFFWRLFVLGAPALLQLPIWFSGGKGRLAAWFAAAYALLLAYMFARAAEARLLRPPFGSRLDWFLTLSLLALAAWVFYRQMRDLEGLGRRASAAAVVLALLLWVAIPAALAYAIPEVVMSRIIGRAGKAATLLPFAAKHPAGRAGEANAADEYKKADALSAADLKMLYLNMPYAVDILATDDGWRDPSGALARLVAKHQKSLELFRAAAGRPFCDFAAGQKLYSPGSSMDTAVVVRLSRLAALEARQHEAAGRYGRAVDDYVAILGAARHLALQPNDRLIHALGFKILLGQVWMGLSRMIAGGGPPAEAELNRLLAALRDLDRGRPSLRAAFEEESLRQENWAAAAAPVEASLFKERWREAFLSSHSEVYAGLRAALTAEGERNDPALGEAFEAGLARRYGGTFRTTRSGVESALCLARPAEAGRCIAADHAMDMPSFGGTITTFYLGDAALSLLETGAAIRLFERRHHGAAPGRLETLVPEYLNSVPKDPFGGFGPLRYVAQPGWARSGWTLYSLGPDRKDDGGKIAYDWAAEVDWNRREVVADPPRGDLVLRALKAP